MSRNILDATNLTHEQLKEILEYVKQEKLQLIEKIEKGKEDLFDWASDGNYYTVEAISLSTLQKIKEGLK